MSKLKLLALAVMVAALAATSAGAAGGGRKTNCDNVGETPQWRAQPHGAIVRSSPGGRP